ncbi:methyltransferase [Neolewinella lacunae]|uniref:Methyltransferase n=1 Tax=Neolewinella lacunae TaxID=1517758 RepID=A0A923PL40_9BACT|nr:methyltransferase [Neolewinella lacunae]MBC6993274.1 methyltransferase [Neolewinella lacunae]MDN3635679.1 methyltransferase [Neolewinella lacunae]
MIDPQLTTVHYAGRPYRLPLLALGGTASAPLLKPAEVLLLDWARQQPPGPALALHDHFGVLTTCLEGRERTMASDNAVHHQRLAFAFRSNFGEDGLLPRSFDLFTPPPPPALALLHLPKSLDLFAEYLHYVAAAASPATHLAVGFQTRHFTPRLLAVAAAYAGKVEQSRAYKKARLLLLSQLRLPDPAPDRLHTIRYQDRDYEQYRGVFSAHHIDYATQFLLDTWATHPLLCGLPAPVRLLDIGCGNGVIVDQLRQRHYPAAEVAGTDVSSLAIASARRNLGPAADLRWQPDLTHWPAQHFGLIVTNPPFHDGHRNSIDASLDLFTAATQKLAADGHFVVVANRHLNYATHLERRFGEVLTVAENQKFVIYRSAGPLGAA